MEGSGRPTKQSYTLSAWAVSDKQQQNFTIKLSSKYGSSRLLLIAQCMPALQCHACIPFVTGYTPIHHL